MKLVKMPDGTMFRSDYILGLEAAEECPRGIEGEGFIPPRLIVHINGDRRVYETPTLAKACEWRDKIAAELS